MQSSQSFFTSCHSEETQSTYSRIELFLDQVDSLPLTFDLTRVSVLNNSLTNTAATVFEDCIVALLDDWYWLTRKQR